MKKIKGTKYATVARSNYPKLDEIEDQVKEQIERFDKLISKIKKELAKS